MRDVVREMHTSSGLLLELDSGTTLADAEAAGPGLRAQLRARARQGAAGGQLGGHRPGVPRPRHARASSRTCTTGSSTSRRSRSSPGAGTRGSTSPRPRSTAGTGRWPTSWRASRSSSTTARRCSCRHRARTPRPPGRSPRSTSGRATEHDSCAGPPAAAGTLLVAAGSCRRMVGVAQLVEHRVVVPVVAGSSPVTHPMQTPSRRRPGRSCRARVRALVRARIRALGRAGRGYAGARSTAVIACPRGLADQAASG